MNAIITDHYDSLHQAVTETIQSLQLNPIITANPFLLGDVLMRLNKELARIIEQHPRFVAWADGHLNQGNYAFKVWIADSLFQEKITECFEFQRDGKPITNQNVKSFIDLHRLPIAKTEEILVEEKPIEGAEKPHKGSPSSVRPWHKFHTYSKYVSKEDQKLRAIKFGQMMHKYTNFFGLNCAIIVLGPKVDRSVFERVDADVKGRNIKLRLKQEYRDVIIPEASFKYYFNIDLSKLLAAQNDKLAEKIIEFAAEDSIATRSKRSIHDEFFCYGGDSFKYRLTELGKLMFRIFNGTEPEENYSYGLLCNEHPIFKFNTKEEKPVTESIKEEEATPAIPAGEMSSSPSPEVEVASIPVEEPIREEVKEQIEEAPVELEHICYFCKKWNGGRNHGNEKQIASSCPIKGRKTLTDDTCGKFVQVILNK